MYGMYVVYVVCVCNVGYICTLRMHVSSVRMYVCSVCNVCQVCINLFVCVMYVCKVRCIRMYV